MDRYAAERWADIGVADGHGIEHSSFLEAIPDFNLESKLVSLNWIAGKFATWSV